MSYLIYISLFSISLMKVYLYFAIFMCKITRTPISFLLHPLDIIGGDKIKELNFFPGMKIDSSKKVLIFKEVIRILMKYFNLVDMDVYISTILKQYKWFQIRIIFKFFYFKFNMTVLIIWSVGEFILVEFDNIGWKGIGIESYASMVDFGRKVLNIDLRHGTLEILNLKFYVLLKNLSRL